MSICLADSDYSLGEGGRALLKTKKKKRKKGKSRIMHKYVYTYTYIRGMAYFITQCKRPEQSKRRLRMLHEGMRDKINTLTGTITRRTFHNPRDRFDINFVDLIKIHGFRLQSVRLPCMGLLVGKTSERTSSLTTIVSPHRRRISYEIYAKRSKFIPSVSGVTKRSLIEGTNVSISENN